MHRDVSMTQPESLQLQMSGAGSEHLLLIVSRHVSGNVITSGLTVIFIKEKKKQTANRCSIELGEFLIFVNSSESVIQRLILSRRMVLC